MNLQLHFTWLIPIQYIPDTWDYGNNSIVLWEYPKQESGSIYQQNKNKITLARSRMINEMSSKDRKYSPCGLAWGWVFASSLWRNMHKDSVPPAVLPYWERESGDSGIFCRLNSSVKKAQLNLSRWYYPRKHYAKHIVLVQFWMK